MPSLDRRVADVCRAVLARARITPVWSAKKLRYPVLPALPGGHCRSTSRRSMVRKREDRPSSDADPARTREGTRPSAPVRRASRPRTSAARRVPGMHGAGGEARHVRFLRSSRRCRLPGRCALMTVRTSPSVRACPARGSFSPPDQDPVPTKNRTTTTAQRRPFSEGAFQLNARYRGSVHPPVQPLPRRREVCGDGSSARGRSGWRASGSRSPRVGSA